MYRRKRGNSTPRALRYGNGRREKSPPTPRRGWTGRARGGQGADTPALAGVSAVDYSVSRGVVGWVSTYSVIEDTNAGDILSKPSTGAGRCTCTSMDALWGTGLLCEGTDSGRAEVVKCAGD